jgi:hypothetical protein
MVNMAETLISRDRIASLRARWDRMGVMREIGTVLAELNARLRINYAEIAGSSRVFRPGVCLAR